MSRKQLDEQYFDTRLKMKEFEKKLQNTELPDGVFLHNITQRIEDGLFQTLTQAWLEVAEAESIVNSIGKPKTDA